MTTAEIVALLQLATALEPASESLIKNITTAITGDGTVSEKMKQLIDLQGTIGTMTIKP